MLRLLCLTLIGCTTFAQSQPAPKATPPCAAELQCSVDPTGRARCAMPAPASSVCAGKAQSVEVTWSRVAAIPGKNGPEIRITPVLSEGIERTTMKSSSEITYRMVTGRDYEVRATLRDAGGAPLWSSRLFMIWTPQGFQPRVTHPAIEAHSSTRREVAFEKKDQ